MAVSLFIYVVSGTCPCTPLENMRAITATNKGTQQGYLFERTYFWARRCMARLVRTVLVVMSVDDGR